MRTRTLELTVGVFILIGLLALLVLALRVSGLTLSAPGNTYTVVAYFDNAAGLAPRAKVTLSGVTVGQVSRVSYDTERYASRVELAIDSEVNNLPADSSASILTAGLLGEKYVGLSIGGEEEVLADGSQIYDTQSALVLEDMIGRFLMNTVSGE